MPIVMHENKRLMRKEQKSRRKFMRANPELFKGKSYKYKNYYWRRGFDDYFTPYATDIAETSSSYLESIGYVTDDPNINLNGYYIAGLNVDNLLERISNYRFLNWGEESELLEDGIYQLYGVSDNATQIYEYLKDKKLPEKYIVKMTMIKKEYEPQYGGWRWHKWGPYIGIKKPTCEYLYDEEDVKYVWVWEVMGIVRKKKGDN